MIKCFDIGRELIAKSRVIVLLSATKEILSDL